MGYKKMPDGSYQYVQETDKAAEERYRQEAVGTAFQKATTAQQNADTIAGKSDTYLSQFNQGTKQGLQQIQGQNAQAMEAGQAAVGGKMGGGGGYGAVMGAGKQAADQASGFIANRTQEQIGLEQQLADQESQARQEALDALYGANQTALEAGGKTENDQAKYADIDSKVGAVIEKHKGTFNDDEEAMAYELYNLAWQYEEPYRSYINQKASDIQSGAWDV